MTVCIERTVSFIKILRSQAHFIMSLCISAGPHVPIFWWGRLHWDSETRGDLNSHIILRRIKYYGLSDARDDGPIVSHTGHTATQCHISISALDDTEQARMGLENEDLEQLASWSVGPGACILVCRMCWGH